MSLLLVDATDLHAWASRREAQDLLPEIVRRLVLATAGDLSHIAFRSGEGVQLAGWDGTVNASGGTFVPAGYSGWEAGCNQDVKGKADDDFDTRTRDPLGLVPAQTTFVFVTPRRWMNKASWALEKRGAGIWKDVVAYDADDLSTWLSPPVPEGPGFSVIAGARVRSRERAAVGFLFAAVMAR